VTYVDDAGNYVSKNLRTGEITIIFEPGRISTGHNPVGYSAPARIVRSADPEQQRVRWSRIGIPEVICAATRHIDAAQTTAWKLAIAYAPLAQTASIPLP
jgi:hypothetical protein